MSAEKNDLYQEALMPVLNHVYENIFRVGLHDTGIYDEFRQRRSVHETQTAVLGAFITRHGLDTELISFSPVFRNYQLDSGIIMGTIDTGLERLEEFAEQHVDAFFHADKPIEQSIWESKADELKDGRPSFVAGLQVMFDTQTGSLRPELIFDTESLEDVAFLPQESIHSYFSYNPADNNGDERVTQLANPNLATRIALSITAASLILPRSTEEIA